MSSGEYQVCTRCVMDTTDPGITFNADGMCEHCEHFDRNLSRIWAASQNSSREAELQNIARSIRAHGAGRRYDCIIGISGGTDSSYMLHYVVTRLKLRPLVFHVDGGWNTHAAVSNIYKMVSALNLDLRVKVVDWQEMRELQLAYFKAGVSNIDTPQDQAFIATLYRYANRHNIKYIFNGGNIATENVRMPLDWMYYTTDLRLLRHIAKQHMRIPLEKFELTSALYHKLYLRFVRGVRVIKVLNYVPYIKENAVQVLREEYGLQSFENKHAESRFTRFYEGHWLPARFGFDTRRLTFSSQIVTGQMTRSEAFETLATPALSESQIKQESTFVARKLRISTEELEEYLAQPLSSYSDYKNMSLFFKFSALLFKITNGDISGTRR